MHQRTTARAKSISQPKDSDVLSAFFSCPRGHKLPHRVKGKGRCAPFDCCETKDGAHGVVRAHEKQNHAEALSYAEETSKLSEMKDRMAAWNEQHELPTVPRPPRTNSIREYMQKRLEQVAPLALERRIRMAVLDPGNQGEVAARELLNRSGFTEKPELHMEFTGPVLIVGDAASIAASSPYAVQGKLSPRTEVVHVEAKHGSFESDQPDGRGSGAAEPARPVEAGSGSVDGVAPRDEE